MPMENSNNNEAVSILTSFACAETESETQTGVFSRIFQKVKSGVGGTSLSSAFGPNLTASTADLDPSSGVAGDPYDDPADLPNYQTNSKQAPSDRQSNRYVAKEMASKDVPQAIRIVAKAETSAISENSLERDRYLLKPTSASPLRKSNSISKVINRLRGGEPVRKEYWMRDDNCKECYECSAVFTTFRRKHHCRICGQIFCSKCASQAISGERFGYRKPMRVCNYCFNLMQQYEVDDDEEADESLSTSTFTAATDHTDRGVLSPPVKHEAEVIHKDTSNSSLYGGGLAVTLPPETPSLETIRRMLTNAGSSFFSQRTRSNTIEDGGENPSSPAPFRKKLMPENDLGSVGNLGNIAEPYASEDDDESHYNTLSSAPANLLKFLAGASQPSQTELPDGNSEPSQTPAESEYYGSDDNDDWDYSGASGAKVPQTFRGHHDRAEELRNRFNRNMSGGHDRTSFKRKSLHGRNKRNHRHPSGQVDPPSIRVSQIDTTTPTSSTPPTLQKSYHDFLTPDSNDIDQTAFLPRHRRVQSGPVNVQLNSTSLQHLRRLLQQVLAESNIEESLEWEGVLMRLMLKVSDNLSPDVRGGDSRDIRHYVKVKKIPGGIPADSVYVRGLVCSKNIAHKMMSRTLRSPRILILTFPLEYQRVENQFLSLEPVLAQEREHLQNLVDRLVALRPSLVLVERTVSRLALEFLLKAGITVVFNVKSSVIAHIARCTRADILASIDKLALLPKLGTCGSFQVRTFLHEFIPGRRRTYLFFDDCPKDLECSLVLRGADNVTLKKIKQIVGLLVFVVYNLKLETFVLRDQFACMPITLGAPPPPRSELSGTDHTSLLPDDVSEKSNHNIAGAELKSAPQNATCARNVSADRNDGKELAVVPPPQAEKETSSLEKNDQKASPAISDVGDPDVKKPTAMAPPMLALIPANIAQSEMKAYLHGSLDMETRLETALRPYEMTLLSSSPLIDFPAPFVLTRMRRILLEYRADEKSSLTGGNQIPVRRQNHLSEIKAGESYMQENPDNITPYAHQSLIVLYSTVYAATNVPCQASESLVIEYYRDNDITLGQYLEKMVFESYRACPLKSCEKLLREHYQSYIHGPGRINVKIQELPSQMIGMEDSTLMWSVCKECSRVTPIVPMSDETWKFSFGKYLELAFYNMEVGLRPDICPHRLHRDHIRCFGLRGSVVRFEFEPIEVFEISAPPMRIFIKPETNTRLKRKDRESIRGLVTKYFDSILNRVKACNVEKEVPTAKQDACRADLAEFARRCTADKMRLLQLLTQIDMSTPADDTLALHSVRRIMQKLVDEWEGDFADLARKYLQSDRDLKRLTAGQLKKLFADRYYDETPCSSGRNIHAAFLQDFPLISNYTDTDDRGEVAVQDYCLPKAGTSPSSSTFVSPWASQSSPSHRDSTFPFNFESTSSSLDAAVSRRLSLTMMREVRAATTEKADENVVSTPPQSRPELRQPEDNVDWTAGRSKRKKGEAFDSDGKGDDHVPDSIIAIDDDDNDSLLRTPFKVAKGSQIPVATSAATSGDAGQKPVLERGRENKKLSPKKMANRRTVYQSGIPMGLVANRVSRFGTSSPVPAGPARVTFQTRDEGRSAALQALEGSPYRPRQSIMFAPDVDTTRRRSRWGSSRQPIAYRRQASRAQERVIEVYSNLTDAAKDDESDEEEYGSGGLNSHNGSENGRSRTVTEEESDEEQEHEDFLSLIRPDPLDHHGKEADPAGEDYIYFTYLGQENDENSPASPGQLPRSPEAARVTTPGIIVGTTPFPANSPHPAESSPVTHSQIGSTVLSPNTLTTGGAMSAAMSAVTAGFQVAGLSIAGGDHSSSGESTGAPNGAERVSIMKTLTTLWGGSPSGNMLPLDYPIQPTEHIFSDSLVIVKEDEPGTIIAFTLSAKHYQEKLKFMQQGPKVLPSLLATNDDSNIDLSPAADSPLETEAEKQQAKAWHGTDLEDVGDIEETLLRTTGTHIKYQFTDGSARFFCKIFFAEQFDALRRNCGFDSELYIQSLARCVKWDAVGGKSGSAFVKTRDDRLVMKQLSKPEMDAFLKFAPRYFEYMSQAFFHGLPTVLAKIFGFYRIGYRNQASGRSMRIDVIVMENLFYERKTSRIFDLKGSTRNRHIQPTGKENEVLLDENLVEFTNENPLFIREHAKKLLSASLKNDTLFLSKLNVMDYSLLVGIDEERAELVVGIVDFIRTFTWDKKIESWVKETGFMGGGGKEPTIISPRQYRVRFRAAMEKYILMVPTPWSNTQEHAQRT